ncbi:MAG TPA: septum formation initiator family protein [Galbitalea sp.]|jgi:cell division protein FtsB
MIMALVVLGVVVLAPSLKLVIEQHQQIATMQKSAELQKQQVAQLKTQVARWNDPAYIEAQARNRLLYVFPGEYAYLVIPDPTKTQTQNGEPISKHIQNTQVDWVGALTSSILGAGLSDQTANNLDGTATPGTGTSGKLGSPTTSGAGR